MDIEGSCYALFAYDIGFAVDLDAAEARITELRRRLALPKKGRPPQRPGDLPAPLQVTQEASPIELGAHRTSGPVNAVLYDYGALCITYELPITGSIDSLVELSDLLYDNPVLHADARERAEQLLSAIGPAVEKPLLSELGEDYAIFQLRSPRGDGAAQALLDAKGPALARMLRGERQPLSQQEVADALSARLAYGQDDLTLVDWYAAVLIGEEMQDERAVLELAIVELLELRFLDWQLDHGLDQAYDVLARQRQGWLRWLRPPTRDLQRVARLQADNALLYEGVNNSYKLHGDQYLARLYRTASQRFHFRDWGRSVDRKLQTLESIYEKLSDRSANRRIEALEWIIIILIAIEVVLAFVVPEL